MGELQLDSSIRVPLETQVGSPLELSFESSVLSEQTQLEVATRVADPEVLDSLYAGPELVLPEVVGIEALEAPATTQLRVVSEEVLSPVIAEEEVVSRWHQRVSYYARRTTAVLAIGGALASAACSKEADSPPGNAQHGSAPSSSVAAPHPTASSTPMAPTKPAPQASIGSMLYPCTFNGHTEMPSIDARVRSGTSIDERVVAKLLKTNTDDVAKCDAPRIMEGEPRSPAMLTGAEYLQKSTGNRVVVTVTNDTVNTTTGRPYLIDVYFDSPNPAVDMGYDNFNGAFTCAPAPDDLTRIAECDGIMTMKKDPRRADQFYVLSLGLFENAATKQGLGRMGKTAGETAGDRVHDFNSVLGENLPLTINPVPTN